MIDFHDKVLNAIVQQADAMISKHGNQHISSTVR